MRLTKNQARFMVETVIAGGFETVEAVSPSASAIDAIANAVCTIIDKIKPGTSTLAETAMSLADIYQAYGEARHEAHHAAKVPHDDPRQLAERYLQAAYEYDDFDDEFYVEDGALYHGCAWWRSPLGPATLCGEWDGETFVPSNHLLTNTPPSFHKAVDAFVRSQPDASGAQRFAAMLKP